MIARWLMWCGWRRGRDGLWRNSKYGGSWKTRNAIRQQFHRPVHASDYNWSWEFGNGIRWRRLADGDGFGIWEQRADRADWKPMWEWPIAPCVRIWKTRRRRIVILLPEMDRLAKLLRR